MATIEAVIQRLEDHGARIVALLERARPEEVRWRPGSSRWSLQEILWHLVDEECEDFRARLRSTLEDPAREWSPIDPQDWVKSRDYAGRSFAEGLTRFRGEREASVAWLRTQLEAPWHHEKRHPVAGAMSARQILDCWVAHDLLHLRQIIRTLYAHHASLCPTGSLDYAGEW